MLTSIGDVNPLHKQLWKWIIRTGWCKGNKLDKTYLKKWVDFWELKDRFRSEFPKFSL